MRFLCLHGRGTNADIFETQLIALRSRLTGQHTFDFIEAEHPCFPTPGVAQLSLPPYLCWYKEGTPEEMQTALDELASVIEEDGPYDGVIGFSEGAALAASFLLWDELSSRKPRFKLAILFNCVIAFAPFRDSGFTLADLPSKFQDMYLDLAMPRGSELSAEEKKQALSKAFCFPPPDAAKGSSTVISIPTLHIMGAKDQFLESSRTMAKLCQSDLAQTIFHEDGHILPQSSTDLDRCAEMFEKMAVLASSLAI